jgi:hypothetical protein
MPTETHLSIVDRILRLLQHLGIAGMHLAGAMPRDWRGLTVTATYGLLRANNGGMLMLRTILPAVIIGLALSTTLALAGQVSWDGDLPASGEPARVDNPSCSNPDANTITANQIVDLIGAGIDAYIGYPIVSPALQKAPTHVREFINRDLSLNNGQAACHAHCIAVPANVGARFQSCLRQIAPSGGSAAEPFVCTTPSTNPSAANQRLNFGLVENATVARRGNAQVFCALGKNWAHNRSREFSLRAQW